jgi:hypothetical protein
VKLFHAVEVDDLPAGNEYVTPIPVGRHMNGTLGKRQHTLRMELEGRCLGTAMPVMASNRALYESSFGHAFAREPASPGASRLA